MTFFDSRNIITACGTVFSLGYSIPVLVAKRRQTQESKKGNCFPFFS
ncbi:MAG TPA: hypothetical protein GYA05_04340 [Acholeplasmataceae bacterium]|nr:hypothetical protein [Acholeplasmataceae bacterium]